MNIDDIAKTAGFKAGLNSAKLKLKGMSTQNKLIGLTVIGGGLTVASSALSHHMKKKREKTAAAIPEGKHVPPLTDGKVKGKREGMYQRMRESDKGNAVAKRTHARARSRDVGRMIRGSTVIDKQAAWLLFDKIAAIPAARFAELRKQMTSRLSGKLNAVSGHLLGASGDTKLRLRAQKNRLGGMLGRAQHAETRANLRGAGVDTNVRRSVERIKEETDPFGSIRHSPVPTRKPTGFDSDKTVAGRR